MYFFDDLTGFDPITNKEIEITSVFSTEKYPNYNDCPYYFEDKVYLGIVNSWVRIGEYEIL